MITREQFKYVDLFTKDGIDKQIVIDYGNGQLTNKNLVMGQMELTESICSEEQLVFGSCEASMLKFRVLNAVEPLKGKTLVVTETVDHHTDAVFKLGTYYVESDVPTADRKYRDVTAYDAMYRIINTNVADWYNSLKFPITLKKFRNSFCSHFGISQESVTLVNDAMLIEKTIANIEPIIEDGKENSEQKDVIVDIDVISGRDVLSAIAEINGVFPHIGRDNQMHYISLPNEIIMSTEYRYGYPSDDTYPGDDMYPADTFNVAILGSNMYSSPLRYEDWTVRKIDKLQIRQEEDDIGVTAGDGDNAYIVEGNFLVYGKGTEELQGIANNLLSVISDIMPYRPCTINAKGNPCIEVGDGIVVYTNDGIIKTFCLNRTLKGNQNLKDTYTATGNERYEEHVNSVSRELIQLRGRSNVLTRTIEKTQSTITNIESGLKTTITQTADMIRTEAEKTYETKTDASVEYGKLSSSITQTAESIRTEVSKTYETKTNAQSEYGKLSSSITQTAESIKLEVSKNYETKDDASSEYAQLSSSIIQTSESIRTDVSKKYETKTNASNEYKKLSSSITQTANQIKLEVSETYETQNNASSQYEQLSSSITQTASSIKSEVSKTYETKTDASSEYKKLSSSITQTASSIKSEVSETYETKTDAQNEYDKLSSSITQTAESITLSVEDTRKNARTLFALDSSAVKIETGSITFKSNVIAIDSDKFKLTSEGVITATSGTIAGWDITTGWLAKSLPDNKGAGIIGSTAHANIAFYAGADTSHIGEAPFRVLHDGTVYMSNAVITGYSTSSEVNALSGSINNLSARTLNVENSISSAEARIGIIEADYVKAETINTVNGRIDNLSSVYATIQSLNVVDGKFSNLNANNITSGTLSADRISADLLRVNNLASSIAELKNVTMAAATVQSHLDIGSVGLDASTLKWVTINGHEVLARS